MAKATQTKTTTTTKKTTVTIKPKSTGTTMKCNICGGTGIQKKPTKKK